MDSKDSMKKAATYGWAIKREEGEGRGWLYSGVWPRRKEAIAYHTQALFGTLNQLWVAVLSTEEKGAWEKCKRNGDRAVKVEVKEA